MKKPKAAAAEPRSRRFDHCERCTNGHRGIERITAFIQNFKTGFRGERVRAGDGSLWRSSRRYRQEKDKAESEPD